VGLQKVVGREETIRPKSQFRDQGCPKCPPNEEGPWNGLRKITIERISERKSQEILMSQKKPKRKNLEGGGQGWRDSRESRNTGKG